MVAMVAVGGAGEDCFCLPAALVEVKVRVGVRFGSDGGKCRTAVAPTSPQKFRLEISFGSGRGTIKGGRKSGALWGRYCLGARSG